MATVGELFVQEAQKHLGKPYIAYTTQPGAQQGPDSFDCSGFTHYVVKMVTGNHISPASADYKNIGTPISSLSSCVPGDILCYYTQPDRPAGTPGHVGFYMGNGKMINALNESSGVCISDVTTSYWTSRWLPARRIFDPGIVVDPVPESGSYTIHDKIKVSEGPLNMRSGAGTSYGIVASLSTNTELCVTGGSVNASGYTWVPVKVPSTGKTGWVAKNFTELVTINGCYPGGQEPGSIDPLVQAIIEAIIQALADQEEQFTHKVSGSNLNMRSGAGTNFPIQAVLPIGEKLRILEGPVPNQGYQWYRVTTETKGSGWCINGFVTL